MMITRDLTITVKNDTALLSEPVTLYRGDRGIVLNCKIQQYKFMFNRTRLENVITNSDTSIMYARVLVHKPNGVGCFEVPFASVTDDVVKITITADWLDQIEEIGVYKLQIQLYGEDPATQRVTIPEVEFTVKSLLCDEVDDPFVGYVASAGYAEADISTVAEASATSNNSDLPNGIYDRIYWNTGDIITSVSLNKMEEAIQYVVEQMLQKSNIDHTHENMLTSKSCSRVEFVTAYPTEMEPGVLYILVE